jgi:hypothetical protein
LTSVQGVVAADTPLLILRERLSTWSEQRCSSGMLARDVSYLELRVYVGEQGEERTWHVAGCGRAPEPRDWKPPAGSALRRFGVASADYRRLKTLLDSPSGNSVSPFMNSGPGVGDYEIEIYRASGIQRISVVALMPEHIELRRDPTLLRIICAAKHIAGLPQAGWCPQ